MFSSTYVSNTNVGTGEHRDGFTGVIIGNEEHKYQEA